MRACDLTQTNAPWQLASLIESNPVHFAKHILRQMVEERTITAAMMDAFDEYVVEAP